RRPVAAPGVDPVGAPVRVDGCAAVTLPGAVVGPCQALGREAVVVGPGHVDLHHLAAAGPVRTAHADALALRVGADEGGAADGVLLVPLGAGHTSVGVRGADVHP